MLIRCLLVLHYLFFCCRFLTIPWRYFQLNARYFNQQKKIFSKHDLAVITPAAWRLAQFSDAVDFQPSSYPIFAKPEWGQNSSGVVCIHNARQLAELRSSADYQHQAYLYQEAATGKIEFEVFVVKSAQDNNSAAVMSVTQVINSSSEKFPVNGIYNSNTIYEDITAQLSVLDQQILWHELRKMGDFKIARYSLKADSLADLLAHNFKLIEVNLFIPMPLSLLSHNLTKLQKYQLLYNTTYHLAQLARQLNTSKTTQHIFFNKLKASYHCQPNRILKQNENNKATNLQVDQQ